MPLPLPHIGIYDEDLDEEDFQTVEDFELENRDSLNTAYQAILKKEKVLPKVTYDSFVTFVYDMNH